MEPGTIIADRYRLDHLIGSGGTGVVWHATQLGLDRPVAIKVLSPAYVHNENARHRFTREARLAATFEHPSAVAVLDFGSTDDKLYLVMQLLVGRSLRQRLSQSPAPTLGEVAMIGSQIASALIAAHRIQLVHRDIKPENVFLEATGDGELVKVVDFGLAFIVGEGAGSLGRLTGEGILSGTPAYMSPEQIKGDAIGPAADTYALGCVLYEAIVGDPPFEGSVAELFTRHTYAAPIPLRRVVTNRSIDPLLDELVTAMLAKSPLLRPPLDRVKATLEALAGTSTARLGRSGLAVGELTERGAPAADTTNVTVRLTQLPEGFEDAEAIEVGWRGRDDEDLALALAANAIRLTRKPASVVYVPGAELDAVRALVAEGARVITDVAVDDLDGMMARLRAGVFDLVTRPIRVEDLARKLRRAHAERERSAI